MENKHNDYEQVFSRIEDDNSGVTLMQRIIQVEKLANVLEEKIAYLERKMPAEKNVNIQHNQRQDGLSQSCCGGDNPNYYLTSKDFELIRELLKIASQNNILYLSAEKDEIRISLNIRKNSIGVRKGAYLDLYTVIEGEMVFLNTNL